MEIQTLLEKEIFAGISEESLSQLLKIGKVRKYKSKSQIFADKEDVGIIYIVKSGIASLYKVNEQGQKKVIFMLGAGKMLNEVIIQDLPASINCEAFEDIEVICYNKEEFIKLMEQDFVLTKNVMDSLSIKVRRMYRQLKNATTSIRMDKRLAAKLWKLGKDHGIEDENGTLINMNISITYLADLLGSQRETISRALKVLCNEGLVENNNKRILIYNQEKLAEFFKTP